MKHHANMAHHVPGRLRIRVPSAIGDESLLESLKEAFSGMPGIDTVTVRPSSGSLILHYDPKLNAEIKSSFANWQHEHITMDDPRPGDEIDGIARQIEAEAEFLADHSASARVAVDLFRKIDLEIRMASGNAVDLKTVIVGGLAVAALIGVGVEASTPMWVTLGLFALNHLLDQHAAHHPAGVR